MLPGVDLEDSSGALGARGRLELALIYSSTCLITMGFGPVAPASGLAFAVGLATCLYGVLLNVLLFSVINTKFMRPRMKLIYADSVCFTTRNGRPCCLFRIGNLRCNTLHNPTLQCAAVRRHVTAEGEHRVQMIPIEIDAPPLTMSAVLTFCHFVDERSPLHASWGHRRRRGGPAGLRIQCVFSSYDPVYDSDKYLTHVYGPESFAWSARFADVMDVSSGRAFVNFAAFNRVMHTPPVMPARIESAPKPDVDRLTSARPAADGAGDEDEDGEDCHVVVGGARASYGEPIDDGLPAAPIETVCSYSAKVLLLLAEAGVPFTAHQVDMLDKPFRLAELEALLSRV